MKNLIFFACLLLAFVGMSCSEEDTPAIDKGTDNNVKFSLQYQNEQKMFALKTANGAIFGDFFITVLDASNTKVVDHKRLDEISSGVALPLGDYTAIAEYGDTLVTSDWNTPIYKGGATFSVVESQVAYISIPVSLANTKVEVIFNDELTQIFPDIHAEISSKPKDDIEEFLSSTTDIAFFYGAEEFELKIFPTTDTTFYEHTINNVMPNQYYRLTLKAENEGAGLDIRIEEEDLIDITYSVAVPPGIPLNDAGRINPNSIKGLTFTGNINLPTQAAIDNFAERQYVIVDGNVTISGTELKTTGLSSLKMVKGNLTITNSTDSLDGLKNLRLVTGSLSITGTHNLSNLTSLTEVTKNVTLNNLTTPNKDLTGLSNLKFVGGNMFIDFNPLYSMKGLNKLHTIKGELNLQPHYTETNSESTFYNGYDRDFSELKSIKHINSIVIGNKTKMAYQGRNDYSFQIRSLDGLESLETLNKFTITRPQHKSGYYFYYDHCSISSYCGVPEDLWDAMEPENYSNQGIGYVPLLTDLQQGMCRQ